MIIIGIDPGTARMGYGVIDVKSNSKIKLLESNVLVTPPELEPEKRLMSLYNSLMQIVKDFSPEIMVVEKLFFNTNAKTAIAVGQARGICMLVAAKKKVRLCEHTALEAKLVLTGYGRSDKKEVQEAVKRILGLEKIVKSDDANDGVAMALCYVRKNGDLRGKKEKK